MTTAELRAHPDMLATVEMVQKKACSTTDPGFILRLSKQLERAQLHDDISVTLAVRLSTNMDGYVVYCMDPRFRGQPACTTVPLDPP